MTINGKETSATEFAYDGCHKIYVIDTEKDRDELISYGYHINPIANLQTAWDNSCPGLRYISSADLTRQYVGQDEQAVITE